MENLTNTKKNILFFILITFFSCSKELSRDEAITLIDAFPEFNQLGNSPNTNSNAKFDGYEQGFWDKNGFLTNNGFKYFSNNLSYDKLYLNQPIKPKVIEVNGIADAISPFAGEQKGMKEVQFQWEYKDAKGVIKRFIARGGTGVAFLRLFDDGWRVEEIDIQQNNLGFTLSSSELSEADKDRQIEKERRIEENKRIAEENRKIRDAQEKRDRLIQLSKTPTKTIGSFNDVDDGPGYPRPRKTIITDVNIDKVPSSYDGGFKLWFGEINGQPVMSGFEQTAFGWKGYMVILSQGSYYKVIFKDKTECEKFNQVLTKALADWRAKYPEL